MLPMPTVWTLVSKPEKSTEEAFTQDFVSAVQILFWNDTKWTER